MSVSVALASLLACNALTGVGDLGPADCVDGCDGAAPVGEPVDGSVPEADGDVRVDAPSPLPDGAPDAPPSPPSFCNGITFYVPFDGTLAAKSGQTPEMPPTVPFAPGRFGQAADLTNPAGLALFYVPTYLGTTSYSLSQGSVALWVKPTWQPPCGATQSLFFKPRSSRNGGTPTAGPAIGCTTILGLTVDEPDGGLVSAGPLSAAVPNWKAGDWNHLVGTWSTTSPTLQFSLNGAASLTATLPWEPSESPVNYLRVGSDGAPPRSLIDELIVWSRVLSASEISAVASSTVAIGVACGL